MDCIRKIKSIYFNEEIKIKKRGKHNCVNEKNFF